MKVITKSIICMVLCTVIPLFVTPPGRAEDISTEIIKAAQEGLPSYFKLISKQFDRYGLKQDDTLEKVHFGDAVQLYALQPEAILKYEANTQVESVITKTDLWYFPVIISNEIKSILIVDKVGDAYKAVALGGSGLAKELDKIGRNWTKENGYTPLLIECYDPHSYLFTVPQHDAHNLTPVIIRGDVDGGGPNSYSKLDNATGVILELKKKIKR